MMEYLDEMIKAERAVYNAKLAKYIAFQFGLDAEELLKVINMMKEE